MLSNPKQTAENISKWIEDYAVKAGKTSLVIGVSGGTDSAVVFRLCQMTSLKVIPVFLPLGSKQERELSGPVAELIGDEYKNLSAEQLRLSYIEDDICCIDVELTNSNEIPSKALADILPMLKHRGFS